MFNTLLEKFSGVFSRSYILCCWFPSVSAAVFFLLAFAFPGRVSVYFARWQGWISSRQVVALVFFLLGVTLLAYLLHGISFYLVRFYEGYWPHRARSIFQKRVTRKWRKLCAGRSEAFKQQSSRYDSLQSRLYFEYPAQERFFLPTRFGNIIRSAEMYPRTVYGLDPVFWWPRLYSFIPEAMQDALSENLLILITLVHFSFLSFALGVISLVRLFVVKAFRFGTPHASQGWIALGIALAPFLFSWLAYRGMLSRANSYGLVIRSAFDLHRFDLLSALHMPLPGTPAEERKKWADLENWLYNYDQGAAHHLKYKPPEKKPEK